MAPFTVLLLYPDYQSNNFGQETYMAHVFASDAANAIACAQNGVRAQGQDPLDFHCLFCCEGHHHNLAGD